MGLAGHRILILGAMGQVGRQLTETLIEKYGKDKVLATDLRQPDDFKGPFETLDALDATKMKQIITERNISVVFHLVAMLSATAEKHPLKGWDLNMQSLFNVLDLAKEGRIKKVFWPSSIAVFGPTTPQQLTPQKTVIEPTTVYGISKQAGEQWCQYYHEKYGVDVRSVRYPGLIGWKSKPGGGTTDYAVDIFHAAKAQNAYECFLAPERTLPMMHMDDAVRATIEVMEAPTESIKTRNSYNIAGVSFSPEQIAKEIAEGQAGFDISYAPDYRDEIAQNWPQSIDDSVAKEDWNWSADFDLNRLVRDMVTNI